ncbi:Holliday junction resolvase [Haloarcula virus HCTV-16]|nr:Holliday junction resolvase [Haloarcula virus HCTV-16]
MGGKSFEDKIWHALEDSVGQDGVVLLRRQSFSARSGHGFQADQITGDLIVDSPIESMYVGVECKTINTKYYFYFNGNYDPEQIESQVEYMELSGRDIFVALEARGDPDSKAGWEEDRAFLFPIELFQYFAEDNGTKVPYEDMETFGCLLGTDGDYTVNAEKMKHARAKKKEFERRLKGIREGNLDDFEEEEDG